MKLFTIDFSKISLKDLPIVGGKNSSLGEMFQNLSEKGIKVPDGFATTSEAYWHFLDSNNLRQQISEALSKLDTNEFSNLNFIGTQIRESILKANIPNEIQEAIKKSYINLIKKYNEPIQVAIRSSATAEDLPNASFAGQQESYLNIREEEELLKYCLKCYASLFTDRAIKYRIDNGFEHMKVALSIGVQKMVRSDKSCSGVCFTLDPETGFDKIILVTGSWGLGENVVQGNVNPDEFNVFKPSLKNKKQSIISKKLGEKALTMIYAEDSSEKIISLEKVTTVNIETPQELREKFILDNSEVEKLARWAQIIEAHYNEPMDIEWAKDAIDQEIYIVQARPETVHGKNRNHFKIESYTLKEKGKVLLKGKNIGEKIASGKARILHSPKDIDQFQKGEVLVTEITTPDWDPILKKASAIVTNKGGRTSHAAIVARETGTVAVVGTGNATEVIKEGQEITVSCAEGNGIVYDGSLKLDIETIDTEKIKLPKTDVMLILADPEQAFKLSFLPNMGVGLMRLEFVINNAIQIHPMALVKFDTLKDLEAKEQISKLTHNYQNKEEYFVDKLSQAVATIAAAFHPKDVIVRMSDFKSNEYANLIGGHEFEPNEANPMIGFRGASRYYNPRYKEGFRLECMAMKKVRDEMGLTNVKLMIPFCRTIEEGKKVISVMEEFGLKKNDNGLEIYVMVEIPSNVIQAEEFAELFDGFSIGSNDLTQLALGIDRDSEILSDSFDENNVAVKMLISSVIKSALKTKTKIGFCGQAPSDNPEYAKFLVQNGINSIAFNPDALIKGIKNINQAEQN